MKTIDKPILFSGEMVRAILRENDPKTMTRRLRGLNYINTKPDSWAEPMFDTTRRRWVFSREDGPCEQVLLKCPYGEPGDRLWVRETWAWADRSDCVTYKSDMKWIDAFDLYSDNLDIEILFWKWHKKHPKDQMGLWRPSIFMPRWASRITLQVTSVRVERIQDISEEDAKSEGAMPYELPHRSQTAWQSYRGAFIELWDSINAKRGFGWDKNPWVWVIEFERIT